MANSLDQLWHCRPISISATRGRARLYNNVIKINMNSQADNSQLSHFPSSRSLLPHAGALNWRAEMATPGHRSSKAHGDLHSPFQGHLTATKQEEARRCSHVMLASLLRQGTSLQAAQAVRHLGARSQTSRWVSKVPITLRLPGPTPLACVAAW